MKKYNKIISSKKLFFTFYLIGDMLCNLFSYMIPFFILIESDGNAYNSIFQRHLIYIVMLIALYSNLFLLISELIHTSSKELYAIVVCGDTWKNVIRTAIKLLLYYHVVFMLFGSILFITLICGFTLIGGICIVMGIAIQTLFYFFVTIYFLRNAATLQKSNDL